LNTLVHISKGYSWKKAVLSRKVRLQGSSMISDQFYPDGSLVEHGGGFFIGLKNIVQLIVERLLTFNVFCSI
jgi:hypothetical protein